MMLDVSASNKQTSGFLQALRADWVLRWSHVDSTAARWPAHHIPALSEHDAGCLRF
jgi:hypothetical protein